MYKKKKPFKMDFYLKSLYTPMNEKQGDFKGRIKFGRLMNSMYQKDSKLKDLSMLGKSREPD